MKLTSRLIISSIVMVVGSCALVAYATLSQTRDEQSHIEAKRFYQVLYLHGQVENVITKVLMTEDPSTFKQSEIDYQRLKGELRHLFNDSQDGDSPQRMSEIFPQMSQSEGAKKLDRLHSRFGEISHNIFTAKKNWSAAQEKINALEAEEIIRNYMPAESIKAGPISRTSQQLSASQRQTDTAIQQLEKLQSEFEAWQKTFLTHVFVMNPYMTANSENAKIGRTELMIIGLGILLLTLILFALNYNMLIKPQVALVSWTRRLMTNDTKKEARVNEQALDEIANTLFDMKESLDIAEQRKKEAEQQQAQLKGYIREFDPQIRTPLSSLLGSASVIDNKCRTTAVASEVANMTHTIQHGAKEMSEILDALFDKVQDEPSQKKSSTPDERASVKQSAEKFSSASRVVVAEDNVLNQEVLKAIFAELGVSIVVAENGSIAVEKVKAAPTDLVILDLHMPEMDGITATKQLRQIYTKDELPIVALTADQTEDQKRALLKAGCNDYLIKPMSIASLAPILATYLTKEKMSGVTAVAESIIDQQPVFERTEETTSAILDASILKKMKPAMRSKITQLFIDQVPEIIEKLRTQCVEQDLKAGAALGHLLKGSAKTVGTRQLADIAEQIEKATSIEQIETLTQELEQAFEMVKPMLIERDEVAPVISE